MTSSRSRRRGFTLVELLVVVAILGVIIALTTSVLSGAFRAGNQTSCLANLRALQVAHWVYMTKNKNRLARVGQSHGLETLDVDESWVEQLEPYLAGDAAFRSPADNSPHFREGGEPMMLAGEERYRLSSYGINNFLDKTTQPWDRFGNAPPRAFYDKLQWVEAAAAAGNVVHMVIMAETGSYAVADHPHVETWAGSRPWAIAGRQLAIGLHGDDPDSGAIGPGSVSNYGFLDGSARSLPFREVFESLDRNNFDPAVAR